MHQVEVSSFNQEHAVFRSLHSHITDQLVRVHGGGMGWVAILESR